MRVIAAAEVPLSQRKRGIAGLLSQIRRTLMDPGLVSSVRAKLLRQQARLEAALRGEA